GGRPPFHPPPQGNPPKSRAPGPPAYRAGDDPPVDPPAKGGGPPLAPPPPAAPPKPRAPRPPPPRAGRPPPLPARAQAARARGADRPRGGDPGGCGTVGKKNGSVSGVGAPPYPPRGSPVRDAGRGLLGVRRRAARGAGARGPGRRRDQGGASRGGGDARGRV